MSETATDTQDLEFIRDYKVSVARLWRAVTDPEELLQWFGPEGVDLAECTIDLTKRGPWSCVMVGRESGNRFWFSATNAGARLRLVHRDLGSADSAQKHTQGWHSTLAKLGVFLSD